MYFKASTFLAPYLHQFHVVKQILQFFGAIWDFALNLKNNAETASFQAPLEGVVSALIWDKFNKQH